MCVSSDQLIQHDSQIQYYKLYIARKVMQFLGIVYAIYYHKCVYIYECFWSIVE
jgi:hypothetical protein